MTSFKITCRDEIFRGKEKTYILETFFDGRKSSVLKILVTKDETGRLLIFRSDITVYWKRTPFGLRGNTKSQTYQTTVNHTQLDMIITLDLRHLENPPGTMRFSLQSPERRFHPSIIYKIQNIRYDRDNVEQLKRWPQVFVGNCCPFAYIHTGLFWNKCFIHITIKWVGTESYVNYWGSSEFKTNSVNYITDSNWLRKSNTTTLILHLSVDKS